MADRFPSLAEFDSGVQTEVGALSNTDDFLTRERTILGDDAHQFASPQDTSILSPSHGDLLQEPEAAQPQSFPPSQYSEFGLGELAPSGPSITYNSGFLPPAEEEDSEIIKAWRQRRDETNAKRAEDFAKQRDLTIKEARQNVDAFYEGYNAKKDKLIAQTRKEAEQYLESRQDTVSGGTSWERIAKLVDISGKGAVGGGTGSGKERFRELLLSLRKDSGAPSS